MRRMYSEKQLVNVLEDKDIVAKTLEQTQVNWGGSFDLVSANANLSLTNVYNRCEVINGILYVIVNVVMKNSSGSTVSSVSLADAVITLPNKYASKIIDCLGKNVGESGASKWITSGLGVIKEVSSGSQPTTYGMKLPLELCLLNSNTANVLSISIAGSSTLSIPDGKDEYITGRVALTLI